MKILAIQKDGDKGVVLEIGFIPPRGSEISFQDNGTAAKIERIVTVCQTQTVYLYLNINKIDNWVNGIIE